MSAPTPPPAPQNQPPAPPKPARPDPAREVERDRLLTLANVQRMRGQTQEVQKTLEQALALGDGQARTDAPVHEMLGDVLAGEEKWEEAKKAYGTAHALDPDRASAERKFAQMTLRVAEAAHERAMADAILRGEMPISGASAFGGGQRGKRSPAVAMLLSAAVPGFGQLYNGQLVKGLICLGGFFATLLAISLLPESRPGYVSPVLIFFSLIAGVLWLYSALDAPIAAGKTGNDGSTPGGPKQDKSGWEV